MNTSNNILIIASWEIAAQEAYKARQNLLNKEHLLIGICSLEKLQASLSKDKNVAPEFLLSLKNDIDSVEAEILLFFRLDPRALRRNIRACLTHGSSTSPIDSLIHRDQECKNIFNRAAELAGGKEITCVHLLNAIMENPGEIIGTFHKKQEKTPIIKQTDREKVSHIRACTPMLDQYGRDLTSAARAGKLGPLIGRRKEMLQVIQILARQKKNNPVLVGEVELTMGALVVSHGETDG
jgi:ATP-dependent Clp protease ATP-binding subunit ClpA